MPATTDDYALLNEKGTKLLAALPGIQAAKFDVPDLLALNFYTMALLGMATMLGVPIPVVNTQLSILEKDIDELLREELVEDLNVKYSIVATPFQDTAKDKELFANLLPSILQAITNIQAWFKLDQGTRFMLASQQTAAGKQSIMLTNQVTIISNQNDMMTVLGKIFSKIGA
jgi:hypothetical protein